MSEQDALTRLDQSVRLGELDGIDHHRELVVVIVRVEKWDTATMQVARCAYIGVTRQGKNGAARSEFGEQPR